MYVCVYKVPLPEADYIGQFSQVAWLQLAQASGYTQQLACVSLLDVCVYLPRWEL